MGIALSDALEGVGAKSAGGRQKGTLALLNLLENARTLGVVKSSGEEITDLLLRNVRAATSREGSDAVHTVRALGVLATALGEVRNDR